MKKLLLFALLPVIIIFSYMQLPKKKKIVFFGDSITQAAVNPGGFIQILNTIFNKDGLGNKYELVGAGISGNKVYDLFLRLENDVIAEKPSVVVIFIGVNDVWHKRSLGTGTDSDKFIQFYAAIIKRLQDQQCKIVICTPAVIGEKTDNSNELDGELNQYSNIIKDLAAKNNLPLVDLRKAFLSYNLANNKENKESGILTMDRVHLNDNGNQLVANEMWQVLKTLK